MWKTSEGSTGRLLQLCSVYFVSYVVTGVSVKYFTAPAAKGFPGMKDMEYLVYNTSSATLLVLIVALALRWYRMASNLEIDWRGHKIPSELVYIVPSGICTAVVIPTTTLMYMLPISVMVAMVIMRGAIIVISRAVDSVQIAQGILKKKVYWEENLAVVFALLALSMNLFLKPAAAAFDFVHSTAAMTILVSYIVAYAIRIYIMNYFKNTRGAGVKQDNKGFFTWEQISATCTLALIAGFVFCSPTLFGWHAPQVELFRGALLEPKPLWGWAVFFGVAYAIVAFVSVFIFMFKGRTATFAGLVNRITSLIGGTAATVLFAWWFGGSMPSSEEWVSLGCIVGAVAFLTRAERKRARELAAASQT